MKHMRIAAWIFSAVFGLGALLLLIHPALAQSVAVADPTSDLLGLEKFYAYAGTGTGSGTAALANLYDGNVVCPTRGCWPS